MDSKNTICIYHKDCNDGFGAAWVINKVFKAIEKEVKFHSANYGSTPPDDIKDAVVYIVDFSYKRDVLIELAKQAEEIVIIDHHKTSEKELIDLPDNVTCVFDKSKSGAMLTWEYFNPHDEAPTLIKYIQDRDIWTKELPRTDDVFSGLCSYPQDFNTWSDIASNIIAIDELADVGEHLDRDKHLKIDKLIENQTFMVFLEGHLVPVINIPYFYASDALEKLAKDHPFAIGFYESSDKYHYSLRSSNNGIDVSEIAEKFGGGGHKPAAGFTVDKHLGHCFSTYLCNDPVATAHEGSTFLSCTVAFKSEQKSTHRTKTPTGDDGRLLMSETAKALVYTHGYEEAKRLALNAIDFWKYSFIADKAE